MPLARADAYARLLSHAQAYARRLRAACACLGARHVCVFALPAIIIIIKFKEIIIIIRGSEQKLMATNEVTEPLPRLICRHPVAVDVFGAWMQVETAICRQMPLAGPYLIADGMLRQ